jgi:hypothetical protein
MLIVTERYNNLSEIFGMKSEAKAAVDIISKFIIDLAAIKTKYASMKQFDMDKQARVINKIIGQLIRDWSDTAVNVCSTTTYALHSYDIGLNFSGKSSKSTAALYRKWLKECADGNLYEDVALAIFAMAHSCTGAKPVSGLPSYDDFKSVCKQFGVTPSIKSPNAVKGLTEKNADNVLESLMSYQGGIFCKSPLYYEHYYPVTDVRQRIYTAAVDDNVTEDDLKSLIKELFSSMLTCWITVYENSNLDEPTDRKDPWASYKKAGITLCDYDGNIFKTSDDLVNYIKNKT